MNLQGKVAIVTGAGGGIGRATAEQLLALRGSVVVADIDGEAAGTVCNAWSGAGTAWPAAVDVRDANSVSALFAQIHDRFGRLDYLVNNAGVLGGPRFPDAPASAWMRAIEVNLVGTLLCIQHAIPYLRARGGAIVNTASTSGLTPNRIDPVYAATKAGIVNLTRSLVFLAEEDGIRVNCVCPALVRTPLQRNSASNYSEGDRQGFLARREGRIDGPALDSGEVAEQIVAFLVSDAHAGYACKMVAGTAPEFIPPPIPQKL